jgi:amino acid transporter
MENQNGTGLKKSKVGFWSLFFMIFCMVSAGAYGIEDMIPSSGPGMTLLILLFLPLIFAVPLGLIAAELGSAIPEEGGYYKWVQRGMGEYWAFVAGWWRTIATYVDNTLYIILAISYLQVFVEMSPAVSFAVKAVIILLLTYINVRGVADVGRISTVFSLIVLLSFLIIIVLGFAHWQYNPFVPLVPEGETVWSSIGMGLAIGMWLYYGFISISTIAGEIDNPQIIPRALIWSLPFIIAMYFLPTLTGLASIGRWGEWGSDGGINFADMSQLSGFVGFSILFVVAAFVSNISLFNVYLASGSRGFFVMGEDNLAPKFFRHLHKKYGTPDYAIYSMAVVNLILCQFGFDTLVVIDVFLTMFAFILVFISAVLLRIKEPDLPRPYKIPVGTSMLAIISALPALICFIALFTNGIGYFYWGLIAALSGPVAYYFIKKQYGGIEAEKLDPKTVLASGDFRRIAWSFSVFTVCGVAGQFYLNSTGELGGYSGPLLITNIALVTVTVILFLLPGKKERRPEKTA